MPIDIKQYIKAKNNPVQYISEQLSKSILDTTLESTKILSEKLDQLSDKLEQLKQAIETSKDDNSEQSSKQIIELLKSLNSKEVQKADFSKIETLLQALLDKKQEDVKIKLDFI